MSDEDKRLGFVSIIVENRRRVSAELNAILSEFGELIVARMGLPYEKRHCSVITLIVDATTDELGAFTGKLGMLKGLSVKSALGKSRQSG